MAVAERRVAWETCVAEDCQGSQLGVERTCLAHMSDEALGRFLSEGEQPLDLDGRGVRFDRSSLARVLEAIPVHSGRRCLGAARFDQATFHSDVVLDATTFSGPVSFAGAAFMGETRFGGAAFESEVSFEHASFKGQAWFVQAEFRSPTDFTNASFSGPAWFQRSKFSDDVTFDTAVFSADAHFASATFSSLASFYRVRFGGHALFDKATFGGLSKWSGSSFSVKEDRPPAAVAALAAPRPPAPNGSEPVKVHLGPPPAQPAPPAKPWRLYGLRSLQLLLVMSLVAMAAFVLLPRRDGGSSPSPKPGGVEQQAEASKALGSGDPTSYAFTKVDSQGRPSRFNPCAPIRYVVNPAEAPSNWARLLSSSMDEVSAATGLTFEFVGTTDEQITTQPDETFDLRSSFQPDRYPADAWAPVLVLWGKPGFFGPGTGGLNQTEQLLNEDGTYVNVSGLVWMANPVPAPPRTVIIHELTHLVGLAHVDDKFQMMFTTPQKPRWGAGDLNGLKKVGTEGGCLRSPQLPS